jgi:hypothetical protein
MRPLPQTAIAARYRPRYRRAVSRKPKTSTAPSSEHRPGDGAVSARSRLAELAELAETGMISGLNSTGHEIGGTIGIAIFSTIAAGTGVLAGPHAAAGISHAFIAAALLASVASLVALAVLPRHAISCRSCG